MTEKEILQMLSAERRQQLETRGGELYRSAQREGRQFSEEEQTELRSIEMELDRATYEQQWGAPPSAGQQRFTETTEQRTERVVSLSREMRMVDATRGTYPAEFENVSIGRLLRGYVLNDWAGAELEQRVMASSPTSAGGMLIPTPLSSRVIDKARNAAAVMRAGAITVPMDTATLKFARNTQDVTAAWTSEAGAITASDMAFDSVVFTARKLAVLVAINSELLEDGQNVDGVIEASIASALGLKLDAAALVGSGSAPEPRGVQNTSSINTVTSVGTPADYDDFLTAIFEVRKDNFEPNAAIYAARTAETLAKLKTGISGDKTPLMAPADWAALSKYVSNQVPVNLGAGTNESLAFLGQWNQLAIGMRRNITIEVAREGSYDVSGTHYSAFQKDQVLVRATMRADVQVLQPTAFCLMSGITVA